MFSPEKGRRFTKQHWQIDCITRIHFKTVQHCKLLADSVGGFWDMTRKCSIIHFETVQHCKLLADSVGGLWDMTRKCYIFHFETVQHCKLLDDSVGGLWDMTRKWLVWPVWRSGVEETMSSILQLYVYVVAIDADSISTLHLCSNCGQNSGQTLVGSWETRETLSFIQFCNCKYMS